MSPLSDRGTHGFAGANPDAILKWNNEDLAVADLARACAFDDRINRGLHKIIVHRDLNPRLKPERHFRDVASIGFGIPLLLPASHGIGDDRNLEHFRPEQRFLNVRLVCLAECTQR